MKRINFWNNKALWTTLLFVASMLLTAVKIVVLPQGGAITYFSLFVLWLITFFFGFRHGLIVSVLFGFAKLLVTYLTGEYINYIPMALFLEYPCACGIFCIGGLLKEPSGERNSISLQQDKKITAEPFRLRVGYLLGVLGQCIFYVTSAVLFYPPDRDGFWANLRFCIVYDGSYLLIEALLTMLLLCFTPVTDAIYYLKYVATHDLEDPTLKHF